ncbi:MAG TPA: NADH-quinone oxidoreductase subunit L [Pyrinomonadaceae bacterium]|nr:NADH-quinone oxidoreductase subunit L [Pyrinomonadaceae bacterium]
METNLLSLIIFAPLAGAVINWFVGRRVRDERFIGLVACGSVAVSTVVAFYLAFMSHGALRGGEHPTVLFDHIWTWLNVGTFRADFALAMDRLSGTYALFITFVGFLIHVFAVGYMHGEAGFYRFFAFLNLFMFAMLTLVLADNFVLMFVGWEGVGLCSYLLIGYYFDKKEAGDAAKKAFITNRIGDWGFILGVMLVFYVTGSVSFYANPALGETAQTALSFFTNQPVEPFTLGAITAGGATSIALLLFIGAAGKSAQIPLYVWLPDAMAGPTPVSALIHAATMVTAGVYMIVRCSEIYIHAPTAMFIVAIVGAVTALFAATIGLAQNDIKKVLAYSTVSQLGYMFLACGVGAFVAAIFHVITHAFFKALLFLGSGSVIHGMHHEQDMRHMGGLKKYMPITYVTMFAGWLAICGIPIFAGFFSKDEILWKTWSAHGIGPASKILWVIGAITALLTAVYMTRMMVMTFWGGERFDKAHHHPHESPKTMTIPLIVLAVLSTIGGFIGVPYALSSAFTEKNINTIEHVLEPVVHTEHAAHSHDEIVAERLLAGGSVAIALIGIGIGWTIFKKRPTLAMPRVLENKYYVDEIYDTALIRPIEAGSREGLWKIFDIGVIDGLLHSIGQAVTELGRLARYLQAGFVRGYAAIILIGALILIGLFAYLGFPGVRP